MIANTPEKAPLASKHVPQNESTFAPTCSMNTNRCRAVYTHQKASIIRQTRVNGPVAVVIQWNYCMRGWKHPEEHRLNVPSLPKNPIFRSVTGILQ
jgi:hypothetical protein